MSSNLQTVSVKQQPRNISSSLCVQQVTKGSLAVKGWVALPQEQEHPRHCQHTTCHPTAAALPACRDSPPSLWGRTAAGLKRSSRFPGIGHVCAHSTRGFLLLQVRIEDFQGRCMLCLCVLALGYSLGAGDCFCTQQQLETPGIMFAYLGVISFSHSQKSTFPTVRNSLKMVMQQ